jgi:hypothetical protein
MANPTSSDVFVSVPLTNLAVAFLQDDNKFIADKVFPTVPTDIQGGIFWKLAQDDWFRVEARERAPGTESAGGGWRQTTANYFTRVFGFHKDVDDQTRANYQVAWPLEAAATGFVMDQLLLKREFDWASKYFTSGVWGLDLTGVASAPSGNSFLQWNDAASLPINDIKLQKRKMGEQTGYTPNTLVLGPYVVDQLENNPSVLDRIKYTQRGDITPEILSSLFGIPNVYIAEGVVNSASEGASGAYSYMFGKSALLCYAAPSPSVNVPSAGYTFTWGGYTGINDAGVVVSKFRMQHLKSDRIEGEITYDQNVVAPVLGTFFSAAVA